MAIMGQSLKYLLLPFQFLVCRADLDPIYYCELLKTCPIKDDGDAKILSLHVTPNLVPRGEDAWCSVGFPTLSTGQQTGMACFPFKLLQAWCMHEFKSA